MEAKATGMCKSITAERNWVAEVDCEITAGFLQMCRLSLFRSISASHPSPVTPARFTGATSAWELRATPGQNGQLSTNEDVAWPGNACKPLHASIINSCNSSGGAPTPVWLSLMTRLPLLTLGFADSRYGSFQDLPQGASVIKHNYRLPQERRSFLKEANIKLLNCKYAAVL